MDIDKTIEQLNHKKEVLKKWDGKRNFTFSELFNDAFVSSHTNCQSISEFLEKSGLGFPEKWPNGIDESELDAYVSLHSDFSSWHDMKLSATKELMHSELNA